MKMRAPTAHERMSVNSYVGKISHNTGVNFFEIIASNYDQGQISGKIIIDFAQRQKEEVVRELNRLIN